jgi:Zn-dependent protease with chaperone function
LKPASQQRFLIDGPAGKLEIVVNDPGAEAGTEPARDPRGVVLIAHPHPLFGGTVDNKVVQTLAKTFHSQGYVAVRMNFRGVGASGGVYDEGNGETEDWLVVVDEMRSRYGQLPLLLAGLFFAYQYFSSEKFVNPETGRKSHVAMSTREEALLGLQSYQQVLAQSERVDSGPELEMVKRVASRLATATDKAGADFDWQVSLIRSSQINAFCLPGGKIEASTAVAPVRRSW